MNAVVCAPGTATRRPANASTDIGSRASTIGPYLRPTDAPHDAIEVRHVRIRGRRNRRDVELALARAPVQRLDVLHHVVDGVAVDLHTFGRKSVEHEGVVGVGAVSDGKCFHISESPGTRKK